MDYIEIALWPDGTWCELEDIQGYLQWMSDDYSVVTLSQAEYEQNYL